LSHPVEILTVNCKQIVLGYTTQSTILHGRKNILRQYVLSINKQVTYHIRLLTYLFVAMLSFTFSHQNAILALNTGVPAYREQVSCVATCKATSSRWYVKT